MLNRTAALSLLPLTLSGCSYTYDVSAIVRGGQVVFIVDSKSSQQPTCVRRIEITQGGDTMWLESVDYDDSCANEFPLAYGEALSGRHQQDIEQIAAKPLRRGVVYEISTTTGATGYGGGRFTIMANGRVRNLPNR